MGSPAPGSAQGSLELSGPFPVVPLLGLPEARRVRGATVPTPPGVVSWPGRPSATFLYLSGVPLLCSVLWTPQNPDV